MLKKEYIKVCAVFTKDGKIVPKSFLYSDGNKYKIDRIIDVKNRKASKSGGSGMCYELVIQGQTKYLYMDDNKWYIEVENI